MGYISIQINKAKGSADTGASDHIERKTTPKNADPTRTHFNRELVEFPDGVANRTEAISHRIRTAGIRRKMKYELRENQGIPAPLLALMAVATGLSVANCYYNQPLLGSMAKDFGVSDFSASMVATLTQIGYVVGLVFVIPLGDLVSRKQLILTNYIISSCALLAIALAPNIYWVWGASLLAGASSVMPQFFVPLVSFHSAPAHKVRNVGIIQSCLLIGILGSRVLSGFLADMWGWRSVYFVACVFMLGCFLMIYKMLPVLPAHSRENYAGLMKSLLRLLAKYPYLRIASLRAALAYGSFFALWSCLAFRMKQEPFFADDDIIGALGLCGLAGASTVVFISGYIQKYGVRFFSISGDVLSWLHGCWHFLEMTATCG